MYCGPSKVNREKSLFFIHHLQIEVKLSKSQYFWSKSYWTNFSRSFTILFFILPSMHEAVNKFISKAAIEFTSYHCILFKCSILNSSLNKGPFYPCVILCSFWTVSRNKITDHEKNKKKPVAPNMLCINLLDDGTDSWLTTLTCCSLHMVY